MVYLDYIPLPRYTILVGNPQYEVCLRVSGQNVVSLLYIMLEIHHSGREPSNMKYVNQGFPARMVYLYYISCLRYTIFGQEPSKCYPPSVFRVTVVGNISRPQLFLPATHHLVGCSAVLLVHTITAFHSRVLKAKFLAVGSGDHAGKFRCRRKYTFQDVREVMVGFFKISREGWRR